MVGGRPWSHRLHSHPPGAPHPTSSLCRDDTASKHEFWPPACAEQLSSLVGGLVRRGGWVGGQAHRLAFMRAVPLAVLRAFRDRLASQLQTAEQFRCGGLPASWPARAGSSPGTSSRLAPARLLGLLSPSQSIAPHHGPHNSRPRLPARLPASLSQARRSYIAPAAAAAATPPSHIRRDVLGEIWLPKVGAAICAAHFTEHHVREPQGVLLLAELQDATAGGTPGTARGHGQAAAATPRSSAGLAPLLEREAAAFGALRKQWAYKVAKAAADAFHTLFAPYRCGRRAAGGVASGWRVLLS